MAREDAIADLQIRAYFAAVIAPLRTPYGDRRGVKFTGAVGESHELAQNATKDKVLAVFIGRSDISPPGNAAFGIFTKNVNGASRNDLPTSFGATSQTIFVLYPGESVSFTLTQALVGGAQFVVGSEQY